MKILLTCHQFFPRAYHGTERYTLDLAHSLTQLGHDVCVLTTCRAPEDSQGTPFHDYVFEEIPVVAVDLVHAGLEDFTTSYSRPDLNGVYGEILCRERPDIIHCCHLLYLGTDFLSVAALAQVPVFMTLTDFFGICWTNRLQTCRGKSCNGPDHDDLNCMQDVLQTVKRPYKSSISNLLFKNLTRYKWFIKKIRNAFINNTISSNSLRATVEGIKNRRPCISQNYKHVTRFIAATDYLKDAYVRSGYDPDHMEVLRFGIAQPTHEDELKLSQRYDSLRSSSRPLVIGFIGQISEHKGIYVLLEAFTSASLPNCELHVYGDINQSKKGAKKLSSRAEVNPTVKLCGTFQGNEIYSVLSSIDILVMPSTWAENSPLVLLNALASRTMLVVSDVKGMAEMVTDGVNGHLCPPGSPAELRRTLETLVGRRHEIFDWFQKNVAAYRTSPLDYARHVEKEYKKRVMPPQKTDHYERKHFPELLIPAAALAIKESEPLNLADDASALASWATMDHNELEIEFAGAEALLSPKSPMAAIILYRAAGDFHLSQLSFWVRWPSDCTTVIYYATEAEPSFDEARKFSRPVKGNRWHRLTLSFAESSSAPTEIRWDPDRTTSGGSLNPICVTAIYSSSCLSTHNNSNNYKI